MSGNSLSCSNGVKDPFEVQEGWCDLPRDASAEKGLILLGGENLLDVLELWQVPLKLHRGPQGPALVASGQDSLHARYQGPLDIPLQSGPGPKTSCGVGART